MNWLWNTLIGLGGAIFGWCIARLSQNLERPVIILESFPESSDHDYGNHKFLAIRVTNKNRSWLKKIFFGQKAALFCRAQIKYLNNQNSEIIPNFLDGRWASTGEPVIQVGNERLFQYNRVPDLKFEHIMPGQYCDLAVAIKHKDEKEFYAFDNISYAFMNVGFRDPDKKIDEKICNLEVQIISSDGIYRKKSFVIHNPSDKLNTFKLKDK